MNAKLLLRGGYVYKNMAGVYSFLPLGLRVIQRITQIIREEMDAIGGQELHLPSLQDPALWQQTGRWDDAVVDVWFKTKLASGAESGLAWTHEEVITELARHYVASYKDLPFYAYQIQTKFRNELRAKSGIMRTREFWMKDLYSFSRNDREHDEFYEACAQAYHRIFDRLGIGDRTYRTVASGGAFSSFSHEFQTLVPSGEDTVYVDEAANVAVNEEVVDQIDYTNMPTSRERLTPRRSVEVGNIFSLGTRFSEALGLTYKDEQGIDTPVVMGSYGIGPARVMGTIVDVCADEAGIVWPTSVAPFQVHLIGLQLDDAQVRDYVYGIYESLTNAGLAVLFDDREKGAGEKFADSDLLGIPFRVVASRRTKESGLLELVARKGHERKEADLNTVCNTVRES